MNNANERQIGGTHYKKLNYEHWDFACDICDNIDYLKGCCTKYIIRWRDKNGLEDLQKARHYLQKIIEKRHETTIPKVPVDFFRMLDTFIRQLPDMEAQIVYAIYTGNYARAMERIETLERENDRNSNV